MGSKKKYDDGDPYKVIREKYMEHHPPGKVRELIAKLESMPDGGDMYGNLGRKITMQRETAPDQTSPVGRVDVDDNEGVTICAKCEHCVPDMMHNGKQQLAYAKCAFSAIHLPDKVNVITGEKISKVSDMDYCSNLNHGECPNFGAKKLSRGRTMANGRSDKIRAMLEKFENTDDSDTVAWEDTKKERNNPWQTTFKRFVNFIRDKIPAIKFE